MKKYAFISRHKATTEQHKLAAQKNVELVEVGDLDAFNITVDQVKQLGNFAGVVVVHPAAALSLVTDYSVAVFENANRAAEGDRPQFYAKGFHIFSISNYHNDDLLLNRR